MTDEERLINESWPIIREVYTRVRPALIERGWGIRFWSMGLERELEFWKEFVRTNEHPMPELTAAAREAMRGADG